MGVVKLKTTSDRVSVDRQVSYKKIRKPSINSWEKTGPGDTKPLKCLRTLF